MPSTYSNDIKLELITNLDSSLGNLISTGFSHELKKNVNIIMNKRMQRLMALSH